MLPHPCAHLVLKSHPWDSNPRTYGLRIRRAYGHAHRESGSDAVDRGTSVGPRGLGGSLRDAAWLARVTGEVRS